MIECRIFCDHLHALVNMSVACTMPMMECTIWPCMNGSRGRMKGLSWATSAPRFNDARQVGEDSRNKARYSGVPLNADARIAYIRCIYHPRAVDRSIASSVAYTGFKLPSKLTFRTETVAIQVVVINGHVFPVNSRRLVHEYRRNSRFV